MPDQPIPLQPAAESRQQWQRVRRLSRWAANRSLRRVVITLWCAVLILDVTFSVIAEPYGAHSLLGTSVALFVLTAYAMHRMGRGLSQPTLEDRAVLTYGEDFDRLKENQRSEVFDQQVRDHVLARASEDLRDIDLNTRAQAAAWGLLSRFLQLAAVVWLLLYLLDAVRNHHRHQHILDLTLLALLFLSVAHQALPIILRLWSEPDPFGDPQLLPIQKKE